jgi:hypothetical protein
MKVLPALAAAGAAALMLASSSAANVPPGNGLELVPASPIGVFCEDGSAPFSILLTPGGSAGTAWCPEETTLPGRTIEEVRPEAPAISKSFGPCCSASKSAECGTVSSMRARAGGPREPDRRFVL